MLGIVGRGGGSAAAKALPTSDFGRRLKCASLFSTAAASSHGRKGLFCSLGRFSSSASLAAAAAAAAAIFCCLNRILGGCCAACGFGETDFGLGDREYSLLETCDGGEWWSSLLPVLPSLCLLATVEDCSAAAAAAADSALVGDGGSFLGSSDLRLFFLLPSDGYSAAGTAGAVSAAANIFRSAKSEGIMVSLVGCVRV